MIYHCCIRIQRTGKEAKTDDKGNNEELFHSISSGDYYITLLYIGQTIMYTEGTLFPVPVL